MRLTKRNKYFYTGPDFELAGEKVRSGDAKSIMEWGKLLGYKYDKMYYCICWKHRSKGAGITQGEFNELVNHACSDDNSSLVWAEIDDTYLATLKMREERTIEMINNGAQVRQIAETLGVTMQFIANIRKGLVGKLIEKDQNVENQKHKCKCPTCGEMYYRKGFYTGQGLWRKMHDKGDCPAISSGKLHGNKSRNSEYYLTPASLMIHTNVNL